MPIPTIQKVNRQQWKKVITSSNREKKLLDNFCHYLYRGAGAVV
ncbi:hypothetical protein [Wolbachia endosymbiont of Mansonella ozzardi]|nr:hypothetical protein [Wolbachia endosymbiont of Mansonella ozzardi]